MFGNHRLYRRLRRRAVAANKNIASDPGSGTRVAPETELLLLSELVEMLLPKTERIQGIFEEILVA